MRNGRTLQLAGAAIVGLGVLAGCGSSGSGHASGQSGTPATSSSDRAATSTSSAAQSQSPSGSDASSSPAASGDGSAGQVPVCASVNLTFTLGQSEGAAGSVYQPVVLTNNGSATCTLHGFPGVSFVAGDDGHQVGNAADEDKTKPVESVALAPGTSAQFVVRISNAGNYDASTCQPVEARGLRVYTPGETHSAFVPLPMTACSTTTQTQLTTGPVTPVGQ